MSGLPAPATSYDGTFAVEQVDDPTDPGDATFYALLIEPYPINVPVPPTK